MEQEYEYLLELLKAFLLGQKPEPSGDVNWENLRKLAQIHNVEGILGYLSMQYPICPDAALRTRLRGVCLNTLAVYTQRTELAKLRLKALTDAAIPYITMKGLVVRQFYPVPELRTFGDVDLLIRQEDRQKAHGLFAESGFAIKTDWEPVYTYCQGQEVYEIHTRIMEVDISDKADYPAYFDKAWEHAVKTGQYSFEFTPEFHFIYMLTHIAKHVKGSGAGVRMYLDIAAFIRHYGNTVDWKHVFQELKDLFLYDFACAVLTAVENWFAVSCPAEFDRLEAKKLKGFTEYTLEAGVFGHYQRETGVTILKQEQGSRFKALMGRLFPSAKNLEARYTYLRGRHYLLPLAWLHRLFRTRESWGEHAREAQVIMSVDEGEAARLRRICNEIGL